VTWLGSIRVGLHVREQGMTTALGTCECYYLVSSFAFWIVEFLGLAAPEWFFSWLSLHFVNKNLCVIFISALIFLLHTLHTLAFYLEVIFNFHNWTKISVLYTCVLSLFHIFCVKRPNGVSWRPDGAPVCPDGYSSCPDDKVDSSGRSFFLSGRPCFCDLYVALRPEVI